MMLYPSIDSLLKKVPSKYTLISLASKRAHDIQVHDDLVLAHYESEKPVGKALEEVVADVLKVK